MKKSRLAKIVAPAIIVGLGCMLFNAANAHDEKGKKDAHAGHNHGHDHKKGSHKKGSHKKGDGHSHDGGGHHHNGKTRVASTEQLMEGLVNVNCGALAKQLKSESPNWKKVGLYAAMLNESGHALMADGRCPDKVWAGSCKALKTHSATLIAKAKAKDINGVNNAFKSLTTQSCVACHNVHRKKHAHKH